MKKIAPSHHQKKHSTTPPETIALGSKIKLKYVGERDDQAITYLVVDQINTRNDMPQIEINSDLGKALKGKICDRCCPLYYEDRHKGITGVYILEIHPFKKNK